MLDILDIFDYTPVMPLKLIPDSDPVLREIAAPVRNIQDEVEVHFEEMFRLMILSGGVGLAAPQVGIKKRFFLIHHGGLTSVHINPVIEKNDPKRSTEIEGCLSFPGLQVPVARSERIRVSYTDLTGEHKSHYLNGFRARIFQHELDHLNGIVLPDYQIPLTTPVLSANVG